MTIIWYIVPQIWSATDWIFLSSWAIFCPFIPLRVQKMTISKKHKKRLEDIIILHKCTENHDHGLYCSWYMVRDECNCYFSFWAIFCPFTKIHSPLKFSKNKPNHISSCMHQKQDIQYQLMVSRLDTWKQSDFRLRQN